MPSIGSRLKRTWNAFIGRDPTPRYEDYSFGSNYRPDRYRAMNNSAKSIISTIYNRIALDCAQIDIRHVRLTEKYGTYKELIDSSINERFYLDANIDQTGRAFVQDLVMSMFDEGCVAGVIVDSDINPLSSETYKIESIRVGKILEWYPMSVKVEVYNDLTGKKEEIVAPKATTLIIENPFYAIMNEPNAILRRLMRVLSQLDRTNDTNSSGKIDLLIQLPYTIKSQLKRDEANERRNEIEKQLIGSAHGIAYIDSTERVIQLNRAVENNLWEQSKELEAQLYNELGLTASIFDGTADEATMLNYYNRTIEPILSAITIEMERKWLSKTARSQGQAIRFFRDPFKLVPVSTLAELADKMTRNEIMTSNEFRAILMLKPSNDKKSDQLVNSNLNHPDQQVQPTANEDPNQQQNQVPPAQETTQQKEEKEDT